jgi:hypothetical protein
MYQNVRTRGRSIAAFGHAAAGTPGMESLPGLAAMRSFPLNRDRLHLDQDLRVLVIAGQPVRRRATDLSG